MSSSPGAISRSRHQYAWLVEPLVGGAATILICVVGYLTFIYSEARIAYSELLSIQTVDIPSRSVHLYSHWLQVKPLLPPTSVNSTSSADDYYREAEEVINLQAKLHSYTSHAASIRDLSVFYPQYRLVAQTVLPKANGAKLQDISLSPARLSDALDRDPNYGLLPTSAAVAGGPDAAPPAPTASADEKLTKYENDLTGFLEASGIDAYAGPAAASVSGAITDGIRASQYIVAIYGLWILPAAYGLVGASVFQLRAMMNPAVRNPRMFPVRAALAMMAGVSISWVFASFIDKGANERPGGITVFGLAFLFGYSIDVFFDTLDRLIGRISDSILGGPKATA
ncbi:MAG TPA: hypothetical protein VGH86_02610 [Phenylobacterium sp.]|jgi:hypothetical protein